MATKKVAGKATMKVKCERVKANDCGEIFYLPHFSVETKEKDLPTISLARNGDHCFYSINDVADHDYHTPPFKSIEDSVPYIERVFKDIATAVIDKGIVPETSIVDVDETAEEG